MGHNSIGLLATGLAPAVKKGRYDAAALAKMLNWPPAVMAEYLGVAAETARAGTAAARHQSKLEDLAGLVLLLLRAFYGIHASEIPELSGDPRAISDARRAVVERARELAAVWLKTPLPDLDGARPQDLILDGRLDVVRELVVDLDDDDTSLALAGE
jgi:hypothetical protein